MWKKLTRCQEHEFLLSDPKIAGKLKFRVRSSKENQIRNVSDLPPCELHSFRGGYFTEVSGFSYTNHWCMFWRKTRSISLHIILLFYYIFQWKHCSIFSSSVSTGTVLWSMFWQEYQSMFWRKYQSMFWRKYQSLFWQEYQSMFWRNIQSMFWQEYQSMLWQEYQSMFWQ